MWSLLRYLCLPGSCLNKVIGGFDQGVEVVFYGELVHLSRLAGVQVVQGTLDIGLAYLEGSQGATFSVYLVGAFPLGRPPRAY